MREIKKQFNKLRSVEPSAQWQKDQWEVLLSSIASEKKELTLLEKISCVMSQPAIFRPVGNVIAVVLVVFMGSWGMVVSAKNTTYGDLLYPLKKAIENVSLAVTVDDGSRVQKQTDRVSQRLFELNNLAVRLEYTDEPADSAQNFDKTVEDLRRDITAVQEGLQQVKESGDPQEILAVATHVEQKTSKLAEQIAKTAEQLPAGVSVSMDDILKEAELLAEDTSNQVLEVIVSDELGDDAVAEEDIINRLQKRVAETEDKYSAYDIDLWKAEQDITDEVVQEQIEKIDSLVTSIDNAFVSISEKFSEKDYVGILSVVNNIDNLLHQIDEIMYPQQVKGEEEVLDNESNVSSTTVNL